MLAEHPRWIVSKCAANMILYLYSQGKIIKARSENIPQESKEALLGVGFEPTHLAILELESSALDHSAIQAIAAGGLIRDAQFTGIYGRQWMQNGASGFRSLYLPLAKRALYQLS